MNGTNGKQRRQTPAIVLASACIAGLAIVFACEDTAAGTEDKTWRGLAVASEYRCTPYDRRDYPYPQSVEADIVASMGGRIYGPYTGRYFASTRQTDIEHIVAVSEAHDSGLCDADWTVRRRFARDLLNLTLAAPAVNRCGASGKCHYDAGDWLPRMNQCWFAHRIVSVKRKYGLTVDHREAEALEHVLSACTSTDMVIYRRPVRGGASDSEAAAPFLVGRYGGCAPAMGRQWQRAHYMQGSPAPRHRAGAAGPSRLPFHARR